MFTYSFAALVFFLARTTGLPSTIPLLTSAESLIIPNIGALSCKSDNTS